MNPLARTLPGLMQRASACRRANEPRQCSFAVFIILMVMSLSGCLTVGSSKNIQLPAAIQSIPSVNQQVLVVEPVRSSYAKVTTWEFKEGRWQSVFWPMRAMVGRKGIAPAGEKREGDGRTPSGIYPIGLAFGYEESFDTKLSYRQATANDFWVDDVKSSQYNQWVTGKPEATSFEDMKRHDDLYKYGTVIEYNVNPIVPGDGSAIFMHVWRGPGKSTSGCVSFSPRSLKAILAWLDRERHPVIIISPEK